MNDLISVVVPVYNVENQLCRCVDSIIGQTYKNIEIILVDDESPDNCGQICDDYAKKDSRIRVIHKSNGGLSDARNRGIAESCGEYVVLVDSDDTVTPDYVEYLFDMLRREPSAQMSVCRFQIVQEGCTPADSMHGNYQLMTPEQALENMLYGKGVDVCAVAKMYRRELFEDIQYPVGIAYEDTATTYRIFDKCSAIVYGDKECYNYYTRPGSISKQGCFNSNEQDYVENTDGMLDYVVKKYPALAGAANRFFVYSRFRELRILVFSSTRDKALERRFMSEIKPLRAKVLFDKNTPKRDKVALLTSFFGLGFYKLAWFMYAKKTGRFI